MYQSGIEEHQYYRPMNEYFDIATTYGGTVINMSTYTDNYVNPLAMDVWNLLVFVSSVSVIVSIPIRNPSLIDV